MKRIVATVIALALLLVAAPCFAEDASQKDENNRISSLRGDDQGEARPGPGMAGDSGQPEPSQAPEAVPGGETTWRPMLRSDRLADGDRENFSDTPLVFGNPSLRRGSVHIIEFVDSLAGAGSDAWDVSAAGDGSALAWTTDEPEGKRLTIGGRGGVTAPMDAHTLFSRYDNAETIEFNGCFFTGETTTMGLMFWGSAGLRRLDLSGFDTGRVTSMAGMFFGCSALEQLDVSGFDTGNVTALFNMFSGCRSLKTLDLSSFDTHSATSLCWMFWDCRSLTELDISGFNTVAAGDMRGLFYDCSQLVRLVVGEGVVLVNRDGLQTDDIFTGCYARVLRDGADLSGADWMAQATIALPAQKGDRNDTVAWLQRALARLGYLNGTPDGDFGPKTDDALRRFQADAGLNVNGIADEVTVRRLCDRVARG